MGPRPKVIDRLRAIRSDWRRWLEPRPVAVVIGVAAVLAMAVGSGLLGPAQDGLPGRSVRMLRGTVAQAREVFSGAGDDKATTELVMTEPTGTSGAPDPGSDGSGPLRASDPVATLGDDEEPMTVAEVRRLLEREPDRARDLVFLPGVSVGEATVILDRPPTPAQMPTLPPQSSTTQSTSSTTTSRPRPPATGSPTPTPSPTRPPATSPSTTLPPTTVATTVPPDTVPETTVPPETVPETTVPPETVPETTLPPPELPPLELPDIGLPDLAL